MIDVEDFVRDKNFRKLVDLFFGTETKITVEQTFRTGSFEDPYQIHVLFHVPDVDGKEIGHRLLEFYRMLSTIKDVPINCVFDSVFCDQESYVKAKLDYNAGVDRQYCDPCRLYQVDSKLERFIEYENKTVTQ